MSRPIRFENALFGRRLGRSPGWGLLAAAGLLPSTARGALVLTTGEPADSFDVTELANGLAQPTDMAELPDGRVVVTQRLGDVVVVAPNGDLTEAGHINVYPEFGEQGLLGVVADPDFASNQFLYFYASAGTTAEDPVNKHKVYKIKLEGDLLESARNTIIDQGLRASRSSVDGGGANHNGGGLVIYENQLYLSVGDTGHNSTPPTNRLATCLNATNGKILRVNLDGSTPSDNPLSNETSVTGCDDWNQPLEATSPEKRIFAWGMRNPYRFWIDPHTSRLWIGDVGETTKEEISIGSPIDDDGDGSKGEHFGWPFAEGKTIYTVAQQSFQPSNSCMGIAPGRPCVPPVYDYGHGMNNNCVIGGLIPEGCDWAAPWTSRYFFGDNGSGRIWTLDVTAARDGMISSSVKDFASSQGVGSFRMGALGTLYVAEVSGGVVDKITPKGQDVGNCTPVGTGGTAGTGGGSGNGGSGAMSEAGTGDTAGTGEPSSGGSGNSGQGGSRPGNGGTSASGASGEDTGGDANAEAGTDGMPSGGTSSAGRANGGRGGTANSGGNGGANTGAQGGAGGEDLHVERSHACLCGVPAGGSTDSMWGSAALAGIAAVIARRRRTLAERGARADRS